LKDEQSAARDYRQNIALLRIMAGLVGVIGLVEVINQVVLQHQFVLEMDHLSECVMQNKQPKTPVKDELQDARSMKAIHEAAETGRIIKL
jgi:predicted dehydrogenase